MTHKKKNKSNFLLCRPKRNIDTWKVNSGQHIRLTIEHKSRIEKVVRWLGKRPPVSYVDLDELGSRTWIMLDGKHSVQEIITTLMAYSKDSYDSMQQRVINFLRILLGKGWITY